MKTKLLITLVCLFMYIPTSQAQCVTVPNQNTVYGTVFNDTNQNGTQGIFESAVSGTTINLYQDNNSDGNLDSEDVIVTSATSNGSGDYTLVIPQTTTSNNVADNFNATSYSGNNGSENWSNNWQEIGESNGTSDGNIQVRNNKLRFGLKSNDNENMTGDGVDRIVDLATYDSATLSFNFTREIDDSDGQDWSVNVQVSSNGSSYTTLDNFSFNDAQQSYSYTIPSSLLTATTHIRFVGSGYREKEENYLYFDNINVAYTKTDVAYPNYIVAIDDASIPNGRTLTTASYYPVTFTAFGQMDCDNNFGMYFCGPNCNPLAEDDNVSMDQGESVLIAVLENDSDGDDNIDVESLEIISEPTNGSVSIDDLGNIIYSPNGSYVGTDSFVYEVCDTTFLFPLCDSATVYITVNENVIDPCYQAIQEQTYFIPFSDNELRTALFNASSASCSSNLTSQLSRIISIKSPYPGSIITYDHWEDGYEADIANPVQATTQVWGDRDITNGTSPEYDDDFIPSGGDIVLENTYNYNPRNAAIIVYDGKDKIYTSNDISLSVIAGDVELFDVQLAKTDVYNIEKFGTSFTVPFGEDLGQEFQYTALFVRASKDNTTVNVDLDNDGTIDNTDTLNEGEVMFVDGGVDSGAKITSSIPVGVDLFFGGLDCYGTRQINLLPGKFYSDTYYSPVPTVNAAAPSVVYFFNSLSRSININWQSNSNNGTVTVPAKSSATKSLNEDSGYKFSSQGGESYVASQVVDSDAGGSAYDWAFNLISDIRLTDFASIAWAPGNEDLSANHNPVWVTPTANTTLYIKYDGDLSDISASTSPCGIPYDQSIALNALNYTQIFDTFNNDNDQSGLSVFTCDGTKIFAVYGENASLAPAGSGALDVGTTMQPMCLKALVFANNDGAYCQLDTPIDVPVAANDTAFLTKLDISTITTAELLQPLNGVVTVNENGTITYTPNEGFIGKDIFEYSICSLDFPDVCDTAMVTIKISACASPANKNIVYGQVFFDLNEDTINNDEIGIDNADVKIYNDINNNGAVDAGDVLLNTVTTNKFGFYNFEAPNYNVAIKEDFTTSNYNGGTGWSTSWTEVGDDNNPLTGDVRIEGSRKRLLVKNDTKAYRSMDLSGVSNANVSFAVREYGKLESSDNVLIQICSNNSFSNCQTLYVRANDFVSATVNGLDIDADKLTSTATFRITTNGYTSSDERLYIDNINIRYEVNGENLVMETDLSSLPAGYTLSTDNVEVANFPPGSFGNCDSDNDFGLLRCNLTESGLVFNCNDNGTPLDASDDFYNVTIDPEGTRIGGSYTVSGDITGTGNYGTPKSFGPFLVSSGDKVITIADNSGNCKLEDVEISVSQYSCLNLIGDYTLDFDGVDDYVSSELDLAGYTQTTVMAWVKIDANYSNKGYVLSYGGLKIEVDQNRKAKFRVNGIYANYPVDIYLDPNMWYHMALIYDSSLMTGNLKAFVNGELIGTGSHSDLKNPINAEGVKFNIGKRSTDNNRYFKGCIDEVRVFDVALTEKQMQKMIHQEIEDNSGIVSGVIIPKAVNDDNTSSSIPWANLKAYYPMTKIVSSHTTDYSDNNYAAELHNITTLQEQTAPMPYKTSSAGTVSNANSWLHGDVWDMNVLSDSGYAIIQVDHNVTINKSLKTIGLIVSSGKTITMNGTNELNNNWYLGLDGTIDLKNDSQLVQGAFSDLVTSSNGKILRRQEGASSHYWYNYWSSPVGQTGVTTFSNNNTSSNNTNNTPFSLDMLKDGNGDAMQFTSANQQTNKLSTRWMYTYENGVTYYDWGTVTPTTNINSGIGYIHKGTGVGAAQQYVFEGKPNNGTIKIEVNDAGGNGSVPGVSKTEYLLGNPYASAIDIHKFIDDNAAVLDGSIQLWQQWAGTSHTTTEYEGGYAQVNKTGAVRAYQFVGGVGANNGVQNGTKTPTKYLPVGQSFMAEIKSTGSVVFKNSQRVFIKEADANGSETNGSVFFRSTDDISNGPTMRKLRLEFNALDGQATKRELLLGFSNITTDGYDYGYEAKNTDNNHDDLNLLLDGENMSIQSYAAITNDKVVPLALKTSGNNSYSIQLSDIDNIAEDQEIYLRDNLTDTYFDLRQEVAYTFTSEAGVFNERFEIVFQQDQRLSTEEITASNNSVIYYNNNSDLLYVKGLNASVSKLSVTNMLGQSVYTEANISNQTLENGMPLNKLATGVYIVSIKTQENQTLDKKIVIE